MIWLVLTGMLMDGSVCVGATGRLAAWDRFLLTPSLKCGRLGAWYRVSDDKHPLKWVSRV